MQARDVDYRCGEVNLRGYLALDESTAGKRPGVLVFHEGLGLGDFAMERTRRLAGLGYVALAADMFGGRRQASNLQEVATLVGGLRAEPEKLRARGRAALETLAALPQVDAGRLAAIGFCFGGSVVLEVADFENEMRAGGVKDWQVMAYGNTLHGFTNPAADGSMMRTARYNEQADRRSWASMKSLFDEVLT
jgi:dienelactone hydrolase